MSWDDDEYFFYTPMYFFSTEREKDRIKCLNNMSTQTPRSHACSRGFISDGNKGCLTKNSPRHPLPQPGSEGADALEGENQRLPKKTGDNRVLPPENTGKNGLEIGKERPTAEDDGIRLPHRPNRPPPGTKEAAEPEW